MHHWLVKKLFFSSLQTPDVDMIVHWKYKFTMYVVVEIVDTCLWMAILMNFIIWLTGLAMVILKMKGGPCLSGWKPWVCWGELCHWQQSFVITQTRHSVCVLISHCQCSCCLCILWSRTYNCCVPGRGKQKHWCFIVQYRTPLVAMQVIQLKHFYCCVTFIFLTPHVLRCSLGDHLYMARWLNMLYM